MYYNKTLIFQTLTSSISSSKIAAQMVQCEMPVMATAKLSSCISCPSMYTYSLSRILTLKGRADWQTSVLVTLTFWQCRNNNSKLNGKQFFFYYLKGSLKLSAVKRRLHLNACSDHDVWRSKFFGNYFFSSAVIGDNSERMWWFPSLRKRGLYFRGFKRKKYEWKPN